MKFKITKQRKYSSAHDYSAFSVVRLESSLLNKLGGRNTWVKLTSPTQCVYRVALGARSSTGFNSKAIEIDYDTCHELDVISKSDVKDDNEFFPCDLTLQKANYFGRFIAHWKHPNPAYRVPMQLSIVGFTLGVFGLVLGIMGFA